MKVTVDWLNQGTEERSIPDTWSFEQLVEKLIVENKLQANYQPNNFDVFVKAADTYQELRLNNLDGNVKDGDAIRVDFSRAMIDVVEEIKPKHKSWEWIATGRVADVIGTFGCVAVILLLMFLCVVVTVALGQFINWLMP